LGKQVYASRKTKVGTVKARYNLNSGLGRLRLARKMR
jgi:hypothetical protein